MTSTVTDASLIALYRRDQVRRGLRPRSIERLSTDLSLFASHGGGFRAASRQTIEDWLDTRHNASGEPIGPRTRCGWLSNLHAFYTWALEMGYISEDPTRFILRPRLRRNLPRPIAQDDLQLALEHADSEMSCFLLLGVLEGLRCMEIANLDLDDVLEDDGLLRVFGKGGKERLVPLHPAVLMALRNHGLPRSGPLFRRPQGLDRYTPEAVSQRINKHLHELGIKSTAHTLRHGFATRLYQASGDLRLVQELLGHENPNTTAIYSQFHQPKAREAVLALVLPARVHAEVVPLVQRRTS